MIGLKRGTVALYPHDPQWDICAAQTIETLRKIFGDTACDIRHVGSTSIPTIKAKPIIDIAVAVRSLQDVMPLISEMRENGFHHKNVGHDQQVFFSAGDFENDIRTHHIHVVEMDSMEWRNYLNFTAYLIANPSVARQYERRKEELLARYANDRNAYTEGKAEFINHTLRKAMVWSYLGKMVEIKIDRPIGYAHKKDIVYPINYGFIPGVLGGDGEELDVYLLGVDEPAEAYTARVIAIVHRENDVEDKLVAVPDGMIFTREEIAEQVSFQEKYYDSHIETLCDVSALPGQSSSLEAKPIIRPMKHEEIEACVDLIRASFFTVAQEFGFTEQNAPRFTAFATNAQRLKWQYDQGRPMFVACRENGEIVGYYSLCHKDRETVELNNLCVLPSCRHQKLGQTLLIHAIREAMVRDYQHMCIGIVEENQILRSWYEKYGFKHTGTEKFDFFPFTCGYLRKQLFSDETEK